MRKKKRDERIVLITNHSISDGVQEKLDYTLSIEQLQQLSYMPGELLREELVFKNSIENEGYPAAELNKLQLCFKNDSSAYSVNRKWNSLMGDGKKRYIFIEGETLLTEDEIKNFLFLSKGRMVVLRKRRARLTAIEGVVYIPNKSGEVLSFEQLEEKIEMKVFLSEGIVKKTDFWSKLFLSNTGGLTE
ncbi:MAG: hypothetical protein LBD38_03135 [Streptococcaceae bacterium]|nr:hypothetical protein [Streptococcaceae bacterium]